MKEIDINTPSVTSKIYCGEGTLNKVLPKVLNGRRIFTITDGNVNRLYGEFIAQNLAPHGEVHVIPAGEKSKNYTCLAGILKHMLQSGLKRCDTVVALGGGVVGDIAGLAASLYMRGVRLVQVPTTLLAQVDSSVGGKTAIDFCGVKNIVGTFYQPESVIVDPVFLSTLPAREVRCGLGEIIKYGGLDKAILEKLEKNSKTLFSSDFLKDVTYDCISHKADVVTRDERESGLRKTLNLGHTTGHAFELYYKRKSHGEYVLIGMYYELFIAVERGICPPEYAKRLLALIKKVVRVPAYADADRACAAAAYDKKNVDGGEISLIIPVCPGKVTELRLRADEYSALITQCARSFAEEKQ